MQFINFLLCWTHCAFNFHHIPVRSVFFVFYRQETSLRGHSLSKTTQLALLNSGLELRPPGEVKAQFFQSLQNNKISKLFGE